MATVTNGAAAATDDGMPPTPRPAKMTPGELRDLMAGAGLTNKALADLLGVHRNTVSRWLTDGDRGTPIDAANALLIRDALKNLNK